MHNSVIFPNDNKSNRRNIVIPPLPPHGFLDSILISLQIQRSRSLHWNAQAAIDEWCMLESVRFLQLDLFGWGNYFIACLTYETVNKEGTVTTGRCSYKTLLINKWCKRAWLWNAFQSCWCRQPLNWAVFTNELWIKLSKEKKNPIGFELTEMISCKWHQLFCIDCVWINVNQK